MKEPCPCNGCTERYTACWDHCDRHRKWHERFRAQQKHLAETGNRWAIPMTSSRQKAYDKYYHSKNTKPRKGGSDD